MSSPAFSARKILVVDDEAFVRDAVRLMLDFDGHSVTLASSGPEALRLLEQSEFDVVFTDFLMPGMKGDELTAAIKARKPALPVVMITAYAEMLPRPVPGVAAMVSKPFVLENLREALAKALPAPAAT